MAQNSPPILVSACLCGVRCRYDGLSHEHPGAMELLRAGRVLPVCPEQLGGLSTPRAPCERVDGRFLSAEGFDMTEQFHKGVQEAMRLALLAGCKRAVLKQRSPSCGCGTIYDGTFSGTTTTGDGLFCEHLKANGVEVVPDEELDGAKLD